MAAASFTNMQLVKAWAKQAKADPQGTRGDVVRDLMGQMTNEKDDGDDAWYRRVYNNVTQRVKQLTQHPTKPIKFPTLQAGKKGARRTDAQMDELAAIFDEE